VIICGRNFTPELIARLNATGRELSRRALSRELCSWLDWKGPSGTWQTTNARIALHRLARAGHVALSPRATPLVGAPGAARAAPAALALPPMAGSLAQIGPVELVLINSRQSKASGQCQQLLRQFHPQGSRLCGAQLRYLIRCPLGVLGVLTFSAAARRVKARDTWIGWSELARRENLHLVVNNSRFLIRPGVAVPNLASHVLAQAARRLPADWQKRYGYTPCLLETFVEKELYRGTSYRASNWVELAAPTAGRGREDRSHRANKTVKRIFVYPLQPLARVRRQLGGEPVVPRLASPPPRAVPPPLPPADWAEEEFGGAQLGDKRLSQRLCVLARDFYARPQSNLPQSANGDRAKSKAAYRFFDHEKVNLHSVLQPHYAATQARVARERVVLAVQDSTSLNYSTHPATENLGPIGPHAESVIGLLVHDTMAFNLDGTPLGLLDLQCWARDPAQFGKNHRRKTLPLEQKESVKWRRSLEAVAQVQAQCPQTQIVSVGDREADIYELFVWAQAEPGRPHLLIRAAQNRCLQAEHGKLWAELAAQPLAGIKAVRLPRRSNRPARTAQLEVRTAPVHLRAPHACGQSPAVQLWAVWAKETDVPSGLEPVEWMLLTTVPVQDFAQAEEKLDWYARRWGIEVFHRTLKSGCRIEQRQLGSADRIEGCLAIDLVVAWRIFHLTKLGRETPDVPCTIYFEAIEWQALVGYVTQSAAALKTEPSLRAVIRMIASLGGFLGRKGDGEPGTQTIWLGLQRLDDISATWKIATALFTPTVSSHRDYG
jgi:Domain of unknown function (DUF4338)/Transposase Tn5 dimerisation domain/Transposase DNA-binding